MDTEVVNHIPPENWKSANAGKGEQFDVYGFGVLLYEVLSGRSAYDGEGNSFAANQIQHFLNSMYV